MKILLENKVAIKLKYYTKFADGEISGMGKTIKNEDGDIQITDIALFDQECTGAHTEIDDGSMAKFMDELNQNGESLKEWNLWWHTHADMSAYWSPVDDKCISDHSDVYEHLVSIVTNKAGDYEGRLDIFPKDNSPFKKIFVPVKYPLDVEYYVDSEEKELIDKEIEGLESEKKEYEKIVKEIEEKIEEKNGSLLEDDTIKEECEEEVKEKVREKAKTEVYTPISHYRNAVVGGWGHKGHRKRLSKKKESYYERNERGQQAFENALDDIAWGYSVGWQDDDFREDDTPDQYDTIEHCPECQNPIILCECADAIEKWGEVLGLPEDTMDTYLNNQYNRRLELDDYYEKMGNRGNILPIIYKDDKKTR